MPPENPFAFDRPLEDERDLVDRTEQLAEVRRTLRAGDPTLVVGDYRHGKTSLVNVAFGKLAAEDGFLSVRVDCAGVLTPDDFARRLEDGYARAWAPAAVEQMLVERLDALSFERDSEPGGRVEKLLNIAAEIAEAANCRAGVCFDEIQDAVAIVAVVDAIRRAGHERASYAFAGPELSSDEPAAWGRRARTITVGAIEPVSFAAAIQSRFAETGRDAGDAARALALTGAGHPQRTNLLAAELWEHTSEGQRASIASARQAIDRAIRRCTPEFEIRWQALHGNERRVAVAIANDLAPQGTRAQRATGLAGFGAAQRAVRGIQSSGVAQMRDDRLALTDPLFAEWLRTRHPQAPRSRTGRRCDGERNASADSSEAAGDRSARPDDCRGSSALGR